MIKKIMLLITLLLFLTSCHTARFFKWNVVNQDDYKKFYNLKIKKSNTPFLFIDHLPNGNVNLPKTVQTRKGVNLTFKEALKKEETLAFLIIRKDSILFEEYFEGATKKSVQASFSMSKSFLSAMIGIAVNKGQIKSIKDPITNYLDFLDKKEFQNITIENLLDMRSGILSKKDFLNPFGQIVKMYYGKNIKKYMTQLKIKQAPDLSYDYSNINSQLLALILEKVTGKMVTENLEEQLWKPLGMEYDALWSVDSKKNKTVKAFCCLNATAIDYAKIGRLYLNNGKWNDKQIVPKDWVTKSTTFTTAKNNFRYSNHWKHAITYEVITDKTVYPDLYVDGGYYVDKNNEKKHFIIYPYPAFFAVGILGQFIYVYPEKEIIIVRLGKKDKNIDWEELFKKIVEMN